MKKRLILIIGALVLLLAAGVLVSVLMNMNVMVKAAIERYGSRATKTAVKVSLVDIEPASGAGILKGLAVANPPGFISPDIFLLKEVSLQTVVTSLAGNPVVIDHVRVTGPEVFLEWDRSGRSNLELLKKNLAASEEAPSGGTGSRKGNEVRFIIRKFLLENGKVHLRLPTPQDRATVLDLPRMELTNIGGKRGVTAAEAARILATALAEDAARTALRAQGQKALRKGAEELLKRYLEK